MRYYGTITGLGKQEEILPAPVVTETKGFDRRKLILLVVVAVIVIAAFYHLVKKGGKS